MTFTKEVEASDSAFLRAKVGSAAAGDKRRDDLGPGHPAEPTMALGNSQGLVTLRFALLAGLPSARVQRALIRSGASPLWGLLGRAFAAARAVFRGTGTTLP